MIETLDKRAQHVFACLFAVTLSILSAEGYAGEYCWNDKVQYIVVKKGEVFFTSEKSCDHWCQVDPTWDQESIDRVYAGLLAAKRADTPVTLYWNEHEEGQGCERFLPVYSKPIAVIFH